MLTPVVRLTPHPTGTSIRYIGTCFTPRNIGPALAANVPLASETTLHRAYISSSPNTSARLVPLHIARSAISGWTHVRHKNPLQFSDQGRFDFLAMSINHAVPFCV